MSEAEIKSDYRSYPEGGSRVTTVGATAAQDAVYVAVMQRNQRGFIDVHAVAHYSPERARDIAAALLTVADEIEQMPAPEPPVGSIIVDRVGLAWQRQGDEWHPAIDTEVDESYSYILNARGPVELAYEPKAVAA